MGLLAAVSASLGLAACGGGQDSAVEPAASLESALARGSKVAVALQPANTEGRLLASNCFQCHGTLGTGGFEQIRGKSANELIEYQGKNASRDIMAAHAQGYTPEQLRKIAAYLKQ
jgi:mono/diheme cytochrome c family protein